MSNDPHARKASVMPDPWRSDTVNVLSDKLAFRPWAPVPPYLPEPMRDTRVVYCRCAAHPVARSERILVGDATPAQ